MPDKEFCSHCGQKILKNKHRFSRSLADLLLLTARKFGVNESFHLQKDLNLTKNQYANYQKLQYFQLIEKHYEMGKRMGGCWHLTKRVGEVLNGSAIPQWVQTFNNKVQEVSEERVTLEQAIGYYDLPKQWAERQEKVKDFGQMELFTGGR